jgi:hypothetical protein
VLRISNTDFSFSVLTCSVLTFALVKELAHANESEPAKLVIEIVSKFENSFVSVLRRLSFPSELACETYQRGIKGHDVVQALAHYKYRRKAFRRSGGLIL